MSTAPKYVARLARLPRVLERLLAHPDGLPLQALADELGVPAAELREDLLAFYTADVDSVWLMGLTRPEVLEFVGADGADTDPNEAELVRLVTERPTSELGVEYVDASELALVYTAARALLDIRPDDEDLAEAVGVLTETMGVSPEEQSVTELRTPVWNRPLRPLQEACAARRAVRISYSRAWDPGVREREVHPYRLVQTRRGWEVDAGPLDDDGRMRTFLLSNIRSVEVLDETFELPDDLPARLEEQRATERVRVCLPHDARWAADMYAERVTPVEHDDESVVLDLDLLPPLDRRVGMLLLASGPDAFVVDPPSLDGTGVVRAEELLVHFGLGARPPRTDGGGPVRG